MDKSSFKEIYSKVTLALSSINPTTTQEPLGFPGWLSKGERADILATPIMDRRENFNAHNTLAPQLWLLIITVSFGLPSERKPINDQFNISENGHSGPYFVVFLKNFFLNIYIHFLEGLSIAFTVNDKREFVPRDQVFHLLIVYCSL